MSQQSLTAVKRLFSKVGYLFLLVFLVGCAEGNGTVTSSPTATPSGGTPSPVTTSSVSPTSTPSASLVHLKTYQGKEYSIGYPQTWDVSVGNDGPVSFSDPQGSAYLTVTIQPNPRGVRSPATLADTGMQVFETQAQNYQPITIASTTQLANETWEQEAAIGDVQASDQTSTVTMHTVVIATNYPALASTTRGFTISYGTDEQFFDQNMKNDFQPMLLSFKFAENTGLNH